MKFKSHSLAAQEYLVQRRIHLEQRDFKIRRWQLAPGHLLKRAGAVFSKIHTPKKCKISTHDCLMTGMAIHGLKAPSLLQFEDLMKNETQQKNVKKLYHIKNIPSDTYFRERVDVVSTAIFRDVFTDYFAILQRGNILKEYQFLEGYYVLSGDGTGDFSSSVIHCEECCVKTHQNGTKTYYHQMYAGAIVHPEKDQVIPLMPEFICNKDGSSKNDCERNASHRFYTHFRREHPHLPVIVVEDGLASNGPHLKMLSELNLHYIIGAKEGDHAFLFDWFRASDQEELILEHDEKEHCFRWVNGLPLNETHFDYQVNFLEYRCGERYFTWVTDLKITPENVYNIMKGGRARWKIENETFNTLKNMGYNFEHNYGHGYSHLSNNSATMMVLAFFIDQIQMMVNEFFQLAKLKLRTWKSLWNEIRMIIRYFSFESWEMLYFKITYNPP
jgi:hypothetical protein